MKWRTEDQLSNPFPGLRPFHADEDCLFFGRERHTAELLSRLGKHRFLAVVGTSGSGKSSLVRAGLIPTLRRGTLGQAGSSWEMVVVRPGGSPLRALARGFCDHSHYDAKDSESVSRLVATLAHSGAGLVDAYRQSQIETGVNLLVVVEHFEEIFRFHEDDDSRDEANTFVDLLLEASTQKEVPIYIVLTMRSDRVGDCSRVRGLAAAFNDGAYLVPGLERDELRRAIEGPIKVEGGEISRRLVEQLLNDVGDDPDQLPVLQHALMRTWERWRDDHTGGEPIDLRHYDAVGRATEALSQHADEVWEALPDSRSRLVAARVFRALTGKDADNRGIRRSTHIARLEEITAAGRAELLTVVEAYRRPGVTFLLPGVRTELDDETVIDVSQETLVRHWKRLNDWMEEESEAARIYGRLAESAALWNGGRGGLYGGPDLEVARWWREEWRPNAAWADLYGGRFGDAMAFLDTSQAAAEEAEREREAERQRELEQARALAETQRLQAEVEKRERRRLVWLAVVLAVALIVVLVALFMALRARGIAGRPPDRSGHIAHATDMNLSDRPIRRPTVGTLGC